MTTDQPAVIVNVSLAGSDRDYDEHVTFLEQEFHLRRIGTNGDVAAAEELVRKWADDADVIAVTGIREARVAGLYDGDLEAVNQVKRATPDGPGHRRPRAARRPAGVVDPARAERDARLLHQRPRRGPRRHEPRPHHPDPAGVHRRTSSSPIRCCAWTSGKRIDANPVLGLAANIGMWPVRQLPGPIRSQVKAPGHRLSSSLARPGPRGCPRRRRPPTTSSQAFGVDDLRGQDGRHLRGLRRAAGRAGRPRRRHGPRRHPAAVRRHHHRRGARGDDAGRLRRAPWAGSPTTTCST